MKGGSGILVIVVGLLILWLGITGRFDCFGGTLTCMLGRESMGEPAAGPQTGALGAGGALDRVTAKYGEPYRFPGFGSIFSARTPPFVPNG